LGLLTVLPGLLLTTLLAAMQNEGRRRLNRRPRIVMAYSSLSATGGVLVPPDMGS